MLEVEDVLSTEVHSKQRLYRHGNYIIIRP